MIGSTSRDWYTGTLTRENLIRQGYCILQALNASKIGGDLDASLQELITSKKFIYLLNNIKSTFIKKKNI